MTAHLTVGQVILFIAVSWNMVTATQPRSRTAPVFKSSGPNLLPKQTKQTRCNFLLPSAGKGLLLIQTLNECQCWVMSASLRLDADKLLQAKAWPPCLVIGCSRRNRTLQADS